MSFSPSTYGLYEQPDSGKYTGDERTEYVYKGFKTANYAAAWAAIKADADSYTKFNGQYIEFDSCRLEFDEACVTIFLVTVKELDSGTAQYPQENGKKIWNLILNAQSVPLECLDNFLMKWTFDLYYAVKVDDEAQSIPAIPTAVDEATDGLSGNYSGVWCYSKSQPAQFTKNNEDGLPESWAWTLVRRRTKGNISHKDIYPPVVTEKVYYKTRQAAINALATPGTHRAPEVTFGYSSSSAKWIVQPDGITQEGKMFVTNNKYVYADKWDTDIYQ